MPEKWKNQKERSMKKVDEKMKKEYNRKELGRGERGKYLKSYQDGHNLVLLNPEVAKAFPTEKAVNEALLSLIEIARNATGVKKQAN